jgi:mRNA-degrading endonuclease RelE of RelBE toxin-antitoxin system
MEFRIADTFTDSLVRLTSEEQKSVKTTAFDLQLNPANPGMQFHKLDKSKDKKFWSVRVNRDIRLIVHRTEASLLLCYVGHHDKAYSWAERRKLEVHPRTGAAQLIEIRQTVQEIVVPSYTQPAQSDDDRKVPLFANCLDEELLGYGVPVEWLNDVKCVTENTLLSIADHLPAEAAEALLELATGGTPKVHAAIPRAAASYSARFDEPLKESAELAQRLEVGKTARDTPSFVSKLSHADAFEHPDAQRRFRTIQSREELERAFEFPWDRWTVFLHPDQRELIERNYSGPARVSGSAGTGKTIVALHRAVHLARESPNARVLLTTFSETLSHALKVRLRRLVGNEPRLAERIDVHSLGSIGLRLYQAHIGPAAIAEDTVIREIIERSAAAVRGHKFSEHFLRTEWEQIVDAWQLKAWVVYRDFVRLGRKTRLPEPQRKLIWAIFERVQSELKQRNLITWPEVFFSLAGAVSKIASPVFDFVIVDEAQDIAPSHLRLFATMGAKRENGLFFAGDLGQRIFQQPFSWKALGIDIRGRSRTLRVNYRTSHQIRHQADRLLGSVLTDADGNEEMRDDTVSVFNGPLPSIRTFDDASQESSAIANWISELNKAGVAPHEFGIVVRSEVQLARARDAAEASGIPFKVLDDHVETVSGHVSIATMHMAKGLEFRAVAVMACDDEIIPLQERIESVGDDADLQEVYDSERHLLYVACTRARDNLLVSGVVPTSEFLDDLVDGKIATAPRNLGTL